MTSRPHALAVALAIAYMAVIAATANAFHLFYILFPGLGALAMDVLTRPYGKWARNPFKLVATPTATAVIGIAVGRYFSYSVVAIPLIMALSVGIILALRSTVAPAIAAGVLPFVLGVQSWLYPPAILFGLLLLTGLLLVWRRSAAGRRLRFFDRSDLRADECIEKTPQNGSWFFVLLLFTAAISALAIATGWHFILFPPLLVMAYENLKHVGTCPWARTPLYFPIACFLTAGTGVIAHRWLSLEPFAVMVTLAVSVAILRLFHLTMPPALSIGLLPFVMRSSTLKYAISVGVGTLALTGTFLLYRKLAHLCIASALSLDRSDELG